MLDEAGFNRIRTATETVNGVIEALEGKADGFPRLCELIDGSSPMKNSRKPSTEYSMPKAKSGATLHLNRQFLIQIREEKGSLATKPQPAIPQIGQVELKKNQERGWLADTKEGFINQRRVLAVNSTHKRKIAGTALGQSKNASITFIEPASTVSMNFEMEMLQDDERKEIHRILRALTQQIRRFLPDLRSYHRCWSNWIGRVPRRSWLVKWTPTCPVFARTKTFTSSKRTTRCLPCKMPPADCTLSLQTLQLQRKERMLVISGPNAGGKSITPQDGRLASSDAAKRVAHPRPPQQRDGLFSCPY